MQKTTEIQAALIDARIFRKCKYCARILEGSEIKELVIDIETAPHRYEDYCQTFPQKVTTKKDGTKDTKKKAGLHALISQVVCVCVKPLGEPVISFTGEEPDIIADLYRYLKDHKPTAFISYNGADFDFPLLKMRAFIYGIPLARLLPKDARSASNCDLFIHLGGKWSPHAASLSELSWRLYGEAKGVEGSEIAELWERGEIETIRQHCEEDVVLTERLYMDMRGVMF